VESILLTSVTPRSMCLTNCILTSFHVFVFMVNDDDDDDGGDHDNAHDDDLSS